MHRVLKYTLGTLIFLVVAPLALAYGLYFSGVRNIPAEWRPTTATYPESARLALWRSLGGTGEPLADPTSPPGFAWRFFRMASSGRLEISPAFSLAGRVARIARFSYEPRRNAANGHLMEVAAAIQASRWPVESQLDTVLDNAYFAEGVRGFHKGSMHVFGRPIAELDAAQLHLLQSVAWGPAYFDPWCHPGRLRKRMTGTASTWNVPATRQQLEDALATVRPSDASKRCTTPA